MSGHRSSNPTEEEAMDNVKVLASGACADLSPTTGFSLPQLPLTALTGGSRKR